MFCPDYNILTTTTNLGPPAWFASQAAHIYEVTEVDRTALVEEASALIQKIDAGS